MVEKNAANAAIAVLASLLNLTRATELIGRLALKASQTEQFQQDLCTECIGGELPPVSRRCEQ